MCKGGVVMWVCACVGCGVAMCVGGFVGGGVVNMSMSVCGEVV